MTDDEADATHDWIADKGPGGQGFYCRNCLGGRDHIRANEDHGPIPCPLPNGKD